MSRLPRLIAMASALSMGCTPKDAQPTARNSGHRDPIATAPAAVVPPTPQQLLALTSRCQQVSKARYRKKRGRAWRANVPICGLTGAVFWLADMDIDCDGQETAACNRKTDPAYQPRTSATDERDQPLDAAALPYLVVPLPSRRFDYRAAGLSLGAVGAVIFHGKLEYGVFADEGPADIIGEASVAMARSLGVNADPATGGADDGVAYIVFTGPHAVVSPIADHAAAVRLGQALGAALVANNAK